MRPPHRAGWRFSSNSKISLALLRPALFATVDLVSHVAFRHVQHHELSRFCAVCAWFVVAIVCRLPRTVALMVTLRRWRTVCVRYALETLALPADVQTKVCCVHFPSVWLLMCPSRDSLLLAQRGADLFAVLFESAAVSEAKAAEELKVTSPLRQASACLACMVALFVAPAWLCRALGGALRPCPVLDCRVL